MCVVNHVSFGIREGEIVGIAGVEGNGQNEVAEIMTGLSSPDDGDISINGLSIRGKTIGEIAAALGLEEEYVYRIQICALGDGDPVSVAHLVLMG